MHWQHITATATVTYSGNGDLGQQVLEARRNGDPWKVICRRFGYCRTWLYQLARQAARESE